jgi:dihydrofolate reductase
MLDKCDVVLVGNNTYKTAIKPLSKRNCIVLSRSASKLVSKSAKLQYCNLDKVNLNQLIKKSGYHNVAILGGAQTYTFCLQNNLLDELYLTIEPLVFGQGIDLFAADVSLDKKFKLISTKKLNKQGSLLLHYKK